MWPSVTPFAMTGAAQFRPVPPIPLAGERMEQRLQRDQGLGRRDSTKRSRAANRRRPLLADDRAGELLPDGAPARRRQEAGAWSTVPNSWRSSSVAEGRRLHGRVRCPRITTILASDRRDPQRRPRRQSGDGTRCGWQPIADTPMRPEYPARPASAAPPSPRSSRRCWEPSTSPEVAHHEPDGAGRDPSLAQCARPIRMRSRNARI